MNNKSGSPGFVVLLGALIALPALGTDLFVPALPVLARALSVDASAAQLTVTTYFVGLAAGQLLWGPLSDRYGRRPVLLAGLGLMLASSLLGAFMESIAPLSAVRLVQGLAMSSGAVVTRSIVRDLFGHERAAWLLARVMIVFSVVPIAAPLAGAALASSAGWPAVFWCWTAISGLLLVAVATRLAETAPAERRSAHPLQIARTFAAILDDRRFVAPFLLVLCSHIGILAWVSNSAFTLVGGLGVSVAHYGLMFAAVMLGQIAGAWTSSRLVLKLGIGRLLKVGTGLMCAAGVSAAALAWAGASHWLAVLLPFAGFLFGTALVVPNATALAISPFPAAAGAASSIIGAIGFSAGAVVSSVLGAAFDGSARPLASAAALAGIGAFLFERFLLRAKA